MQRVVIKFLWAFLVLASVASSQPERRFALDTKVSDEEVVKMFMPGMVPSVDDQLLLRKPRQLRISSEKYPIPSVEISGPEVVRPGGRMVIVRANINQSTPLENLISVKYQWAVFSNGKYNPGVMPWPDGSLIALASSEEEGYGTVILDTNYMFGVSRTVDGKTIYEDVELVSPPLATFTFEVRESGPTPPNPPNPPTPANPPNPPPNPPAPDPVFPPGRFGLSSFVYEAFKADTRLSQSEKLQLATALATSYRGIASKIAAIPSYTDVVQILKDTAEYNRAAVTTAGVDRDKTLALNKVIGDKIYELMAGKSYVVKTASDVKDAWIELATGLAAVK